MLATRLLVVRHRESVWNAERRWTGCADVPLSAVGREQAARMVPQLAELGIDAVVSSNLGRAWETASIIGRALGLSVPVTDARLREHDTPRWSGLTRDEIDVIDPGVMDGWRSGRQLDLPGAELWRDFEDRVVAGMHSVASLGRCVLVVAHAGVLRAAHTAIGGSDAKTSRTKGLWISAENGTLRLDGMHRVLPSADQAEGLVARPAA
jgi:glucosyl-3-phosphoglycerate phosphatase